MADPLEDQTVPELKDQLRDRDLPVSGTKDELIERLNEGSVPGPGNVEVPDKALEDPPSTIEAVSGRHPDDAPVSVDPTPEDEIEANAGLKPVPLEGSSFPSDARTSDSAPSTPGQEKPPATLHPPLVPETDMSDRSTDPTATLQQADDPFVKVMDAKKPSLKDLVTALDQEWERVKQLHWNVDPSHIDHLISAFHSHVGTPPSDKG